MPELTRTSVGGAGRGGGIEFGYSGVEEDRIQRKRTRSQLLVLLAEEVAAMAEESKTPSGKARAARVRTLLKRLTPETERVRVARPDGDPRNKVKGNKGQT